MRSDKDIEKSLNEFDDSELKKIIEQAGFLKVPSKTSKAEAWDKFVKNISTTEGNSKTTVPHIQTLNIKRIIYYAAASIILLLGGIITFYAISIKVINVPHGEIATVKLPDETSVKINAGSKLKYNKLNWNSKRKVKLTGEAFFNVTKGSEFSVISDGNNLSVLGTSFNVFYRNSEYKVQCYTGKVKINVPATEPVVLNKGEALKAINKKIIEKKVTFNKEQTSGWIRGEFYFNQEPLNKVLNELERQFNVEIKAYNINNRVYTGIFKNNNLEDALYSVCLPMNLKFEITNNVVTIR